jgi:hypothetical protein
MRNIIGILAAILLALAVTEAQDKTAAKPNDTTEKVLIANERALHEAVAKADKSSFLSLVLVPEGIWTTKEGFIPMELLVNGLEQFELTKWDIVNPRVTWIDEASAIVVYVWTGTGTLHNQPLASPTLASTVWTRRNGKWLAVHHQQTDLIKN